jgi:hypothetical protein
MRPSRTGPLHVSQLDPHMHNAPEGHSASGGVIRPSGGAHPRSTSGLELDAGVTYGGWLTSSLCDILALAGPLPPTPNPTGKRYARRRKAVGSSSRKVGAGGRGRCRQDRWNERKKGGKIARRRYGMRHLPSCTGIVVAGDVSTRGRAPLRLDRGFSPPHGLPFASPPPFLSGALWICPRYLLLESS